MKDERLFSIIIIFIIVIVLASQQNKKSTYLVKRLDRQVLERKEFISPQQIGDTVTAYDKLNGADGPIFLPVDVVIIDTIL